MAGAKIVISAVDRTAGAFASVGAKARDLNGQIGKIGSGFGAIGSAIGVALAGFGLGGLLRDTTDAVLAIKDLSEATGATIENVSGLENIARRAGGSIEDVSGVIIKFNAALKDSARTKEIGAAFKSLGLDADKLRQLDPAAALLETAKALDQFADDGNRARLQQELFGRSVKIAAPLLREMAEAGALNATVTSEQVQEVDRFNKLLARLSVSAHDAARSLLVDLVPALSSVLDTFNRGGVAGLFSALNNSDLGKKLGVSDIQVAQRAVAGLSKELAGLRADAAVPFLNSPALRAQVTAAERDLAAAQAVLGRLQRAEQRAAGFSAGGEDFVPPSGLAAPKPSIKPPRAALELKPFDLPQISESMRDALRAIDQTDTAKVAKLSAALDDLFALRAGGLGSDDGIDAAIESLRDQLEKLSPSAQAAAQAAERLKSLLADTRQSRTEGVIGDVEFLNAQFDAGKIKSADQWADAVRRVAERLHEVDPDAKDAAKSVEQLGMTFSSAFEDAIVSGRELSEVLKGLAQDVLRIFLRRTITEPAGNWLASQVGTMFPARAMGGPVSAGQPYLVGERGPEIMVPSLPGTVIPNKAAMAGPQFTYAPTIHVNGDVGPATVAAIRDYVARDRAAWMRNMQIRGA